MPVMSKQETLSRKHSKKSYPLCLAYSKHAEKKKKKGRNKKQIKIQIKQDGNKDR